MFGLFSNERVTPVVGNPQLDQIKMAALDAALQINRSQPKTASEVIKDAAAVEAYIKGA